MNVALKVLIWMGATACIWTGVAAVLLALRRGGPRRPRVYVLLYGAALAAMLGMAVLPGPSLAATVYACVFLVPVILWPHKEDQHSAFVWMKRRLRRRGRALGPFWENVSDYYYWQEKPQLAGQEGVATELEAADAPAGRGTEPEASSAPVGRGDELIGTQAEGVSEHDRLPAHLEHERRPGRT